MSTMCNTSGSSALSFFLDGKRVNNFQNIIKYFNAHWKIPLRLSNRFTVHHHRHTVIGET